MTDPYYMLHTDLVDAATLGASGSQIAKRMFQKTYGKLLTIYCAKCVYVRTSLRCAYVVQSRRASDPETHGKIELLTSEEVAPQVA